MRCLNPRIKRAAATFNILLGGTGVRGERCSAWAVVAAANERQHRCEGANKCSHERVGQRTEPENPAAGASSGCGTHWSTRRDSGRHDTAAERFTVTIEKDTAAFIDLNEIIVYFDAADIVFILA